MNLRTLQQMGAARSATALTCTWIATGNPRQPLACVWLDNEVRFVMAATGTADRAPNIGEDHLGGLAA